MVGSPVMDRSPPLSLANLILSKTLELGTEYHFIGQKSNLECKECGEQKMATFFEFTGSAVNQSPFSSLCILFPTPSNLIPAQSIAPQ